MSSFSAIKKNAEGFADLVAAAAAAAAKARGPGLDYNEMATAYNKLKTGEFLAFPRPAKSVPNVSNRLAERGLTANTDVQVFAIDDQGTETIVVMRKSTAELQTIEPKQRGPKAKSKA